MCGKVDIEALSALDRLGFFAEDLLVNFLLVPLAAAVLALLLPRRARTIFFAAATAFLILLYFIELRAYHSIGQFISGQLLSDSFHWVSSNPGSAGGLRHGRQYG